MSERRPMDGGLPPPVPGWRGRPWVPGCLGFLVGLLLGIPLLLVIGGVGYLVRGGEIPIPWRIVGPVIGGALAAAAFVAVWKRGRRGFSRGVLIGAGVFSLLFGVCSSFF